MSETGSTISAIEPQKKAKHRYSVFVDGEFALGVDEAVLLKYGLRKGDPLPNDRRRGIEREDYRARLQDRVYRFLGYRDRSEKEIRDRLKLWECSPEHIDWIVNDLQTRKLIDDERFARSMAASKMATSPVGRRMLKLELLRRGVSEEITDRTLDDVFQQHSELGLARELLRKRARRYAALEPAKARQRMVNFLARRGFDFETIEQALVSMNDHDSAGAST